MLSENLKLLGNIGKCCEQSEHVGKHLKVLGKFYRTPPIPNQIGMRRTMAEPYNMSHLQHVDFSNIGRKGIRWCQTGSSTLVNATHWWRAVGAACNQCTLVLLGFMQCFEV